MIQCKHNIWFHVFFTLVAKHSWDWVAVLESIPATLGWEVGCTLDRMPTDTYGINFKILHYVKLLHLQDFQKT